MGGICVNQKKEEKKENTQEMSDSDSDTEVQQEFGQRYDSDDGQKKKPSKKSRAKKPSKKPVKKATKKNSAKKPSVKKSTKVTKDLSFLIVKKDMLRFIRERLNAGERVSKQFLDFANAQLHEWTKYVLGFLAISSHGSNSEGKRGKSNCNSPRLSLDVLNKALLLATDKKFLDRVNHMGVTLYVNKTAIGNMLRAIMGEKSSVARDALEQMEVALELRLNDIVKVAIQQMRKKKRVTLKVCPDAMQMAASTEDMRAATDEEDDEDENEETDFDESDGGAEEPLVINVSY